MLIVRLVDLALAFVLTAATVVLVTSALVSVSVALEGSANWQPSELPVESSFRTHAASPQQYVPAIIGKEPAAIMSPCLVSCTSPMKPFAPYVFSQISLP